VQLLAFEPHGDDPEALRDITRHFGERRSLKLGLLDLDSRKPALFGENLQYVVLGDQPLFHEHRTETHDGLGALLRNRFGGIAVNPPALD